MSRIGLSAFSLCSLMLLAGCGGTSSDPWERAGTWQPTGANDANLRAMLVNPNDMVVGQAAQGSSSILANAAVTRVLTDKVKPLPTQSTGGPGSGGGSTGGGTGGTTTGLGAAGGGQ